MSVDITVGARFEIIPYDGMQEGEIVGEVISIGNGYVQMGMDRTGRIVKVATDRIVREIGFNG